MNLMGMKKKIQVEMERQGFNKASLAKAAGLGSTAVRDLLENEDQDPRIGTLDKVCNALNIPLASLFSDNILFRDGSVLVPELNIKVSAGHGSVIEREEVENTWAIPRSYLETLTFSNLNALRIIVVKGDSMLPEYRPGDRILVDTSNRTPSDGDFVIVDGWDCLMVKKLQSVTASNPPRLKVISTNKEYETFEVAASDIHINGKVVGKWVWK